MARIPFRSLYAACCVLLLATLFASGCAGGQRPEMRYYLLSPVAASHEAAGLRTPVIIGPLELPGYVNRPQLMLRSADGELLLREYHRWAEPLDALVLRTLAENVSRLTGSDAVVAFPAPARVDTARRVTGRVLRFDIDGRGEAVLRVQWILTEPDDLPASPVRLSEYRVRADGPGEAAGVAALDQALAAFARDLADALAGR